MRPIRKRENRVSIRVAPRLELVSQIVYELAKPLVFNAVDNS